MRFTEEFSLLFLICYLKTITEEEKCNLMFLFIFEYYDIFSPIVIFMNLTKFSLFKIIGTKMK